MPAEAGTAGVDARESNAETARLLPLRGALTDAIDVALREKEEADAAEHHRRLADAHQGSFLAHLWDHLASHFDWAPSTEPPGAADGPAVPTQPRALSLRPLRPDPPRPQAMSGSPRDEADDDAYDDEPSPEMDETTGFVRPVVVPRRAAAPGIAAAARRCLAYAGPGLLISIAYLDPGNLESDLLSGARYGYSLLWVLLWSTALGLALQLLAVRLALATHAHLARACREEYPLGARLLLWLAAEAGLVASDIPEVLGTAFALKLLFGLPTPAGVVVACGLALGILLLAAGGIRRLEAAMAALVGIMGLCYVIENLRLQPRGAAADIASGLALPRITDSGAAVLALSLVGAVLMPHNLYLHSALVLSREVPPGPAALADALTMNTAECAAALAASLFINASVVCLAAAMAPRLPASVRDAVAREPLQSTPHLLRGLLGPWAEAVFGAALLASGLSASVTGTFAGQFVVDGFWAIRLPPARRAAVTRLAAVGPALAVTLIFGDAQAESLIVACSVALAFTLPYALVPLLKLCGSARVMGPLALSPVTAGVYWAAAAAVCASNLGLVASALIGAGVVGPTGGRLAMAFLCATLACLYLASLAYLCWRPVTWDGRLPTAGGGRPPPPHALGDDGEEETLEGNSAEGHSQSQSHSQSKSVVGGGDAANSTPESVVPGRAHGSHGHGAAEAAHRTAHSD